MLDDQVLPYAACTFRDFLNWTNRVQQVQYMETQISVAERFRLVCRFESFTSLFLRTFCPGYVLAFFFFFFCHGLHSEYTTT